MFSGEFLRTAFLQNTSSGCFCFWNALKKSLSWHLVQKYFAWKSTWMIFKKILKSEKNTNNKYEMKVKSYVFLRKRCRFASARTTFAASLFGVFLVNFFKTAVRGSHGTCSIKKVFLKISQNLQEINMWWSFFFNKRHIFF